MSDELLLRLKTFLRPLCDGGLALAFSGGVDSTLLLAVLRQLRDESDFPLTAMIMQTPFMRQADLDHAQRCAVQLQVPLQVLTCDPLSLPQVKANALDRCYWCKRFIFSRFLERCGELQLQTLLDGTNADDHQTYRPGLAALAELKVVSPLASVQATKADIRRLAAQLGLACATQPSTPCLATRFDYGTTLTPERVSLASRGEDLIRRYLQPENNLRLRIHERLARIEVDGEALTGLLAQRREITRELKTLGFDYVTLDLEGFRSGSMDVGIMQQS